MKKIVLFLFICLLSLNDSAFAQCNCQVKCNCGKQFKAIGTMENSLNDDLGFCRNFAEQVKKERAAVSNVLGLTEQQAEFRRELVRNNSAALEEKFHELYIENFNLRTYKVENADCKIIKAQEKNVNCIKKEIKCIVDKENKDFKKILDRDQRAKLRMIQKLERKTVKDCAKQKNYYKSNPKMRPFAIRNNQDCSCIERVEY